MLSIFVLRIRTDALAVGEVAGEIEHVETRTRQRVRSLDELVEFITHIAATDQEANCEHEPHAPVARLIARGDSADAVKGQIETVETGVQAVFSKHRRAHGFLWRDPEEWKAEQ